MRMYDLAFLERARQLCTQYDVLLIFDEVATGFGRTGHRFVADRVLPDILVLGKALTGATSATRPPWPTTRSSRPFTATTPATPSCTAPPSWGNALACAAALKGIELFEREDYMAKIRRIEAISRRELAGLADPRIKEVRILGACTCIEVHDPQTLAGFQDFAYQRGVFSRPFLSYLYTMVPYIIGEEELVQIFDTMKAWFARG